MFHGGPFIGVVHLLPLPGSPEYGGSMEAVVARAVQDAKAYADGGADALIVENYGDFPFRKDGLAPETVASLGRCAGAVTRAVGVPLGINALRNDARAALGVAASVDAAFVRINVHAGVVATDQGVIEGRAAETLRVRRSLGLRTRIAADVFVKHARPLYSDDIAQAARDLVQRSGADAVIVSGSATGAETSLDDLRRVREAVPDAPVFAGSGVTRETAAEVLRYADAVIVGTSLKQDGITGAPVDIDRVRRFARAIAAAKAP